MPGEVAREEPGPVPEVGSGERCSPGSLAELTALARVSALQPLRPIPDDVPAEVRDFAETLRVLFSALGISLNRLAALLHSDPGTVSRYLSGKRIPPPGFIDGLRKAVYDAKGSLVTEQVTQLVHEQFLVALQVHDPARYEVQRLTALLEVAAKEKQQYEITVRALEEAIASRNDKIYDLELEGRQLRSALGLTEGLLEQERRHRERLQEATDGLHTEVRALIAQLASAQRRAAVAEERCFELEARLDSAGALLRDEYQGTATGRDQGGNSPGVPPDRDLGVLERAAQLIRVYEVQFVPSLLQTQDYARAVIEQGSPSLDTDELERRVQLRIDRQQEFSRRSPRLWAIVDEAALRRPMGGRDVHLAQIRRLLDVIGEPNITLQIMPFKYGGHAAEGGPFMIMRFPEIGLPDIVYTEYLTGTHYIDKEDEVWRYGAVMERLSVASTSPQRARGILSGMLREI